MMVSLTTATPLWCSSGLNLNSIFPPNRWGFSLVFCSNSKYFFMSVMMASVFFSNYPSSLSLRLLIASCTSPSLTSFYSSSPSSSSGTPAINFCILFTNTSFSTVVLLSESRVAIISLFGPVFRSTCCIIFT